MKNNKAAGRHPLWTKETSRSRCPSVATTYVPDLQQDPEALKTSKNRDYPEIQERSIHPKKLPAHLPAVPHIQAIWETPFEQSMFLNMRERLLFFFKTPFEHAPFVDEHLIPEQAGFWPGKSCTGQLLNLPQFIEDDYEEGLITGAAFVDLSTAYDTVNHRILVQKLFQLRKDARLINLIQNRLENRHFFVDLKGKRSTRWSTSPLFYSLLHYFTQLL